MAAQGCGPGGSRSAAEPCIMRRMIGRLLAVCGWLAWRAQRLPGKRVPRAVAPVVIGVVLLVLAVLPIVVPLLDAQPEDATVQQVFDGAITEPTGWIRLHGRIAPLQQSPTEQEGNYALFVDAANTLRAIVVRSDTAPEAAASTTVTGHLVTTGVLVEEEIPHEATVFGAPPQIVLDRILELDATVKGDRLGLWPISILPALLAIIVLIGWRVGYPIFRPTTEVDVLSGPLGPGERLPSAFGGTVGGSVRDLADPSGALLVVRRGPKGNLLTAQPLPDDGGVAPPPVTIGGSWTSGRVGHVYTVTETIPALTIRSELVDATFLFARTSERDRVAALIAVER